MSPSNKRRALALIALLLVVGIAAYWWLSPLLTIRAMQTAAQRGDADAFSEHVDYPSLRQSLKSQVAALAAAKLGASMRGNGLAGIGALIGASLAGGLIDVLVQPAVVMQVMQEGRLLPRLGDGPSTSSTPPSAAGDSGARRIRWTIERQGFDTFLAHADPAGGAEADRRLTLVMKRTGFADWRLTEIRLPSR